MPSSESDIKLLAKAVYETRLLLSGYLGSSNEGDAAVRQAAHLSYALHNEALAVIEGRGFELRAATRRIRAIDSIIPGCDLSSRILDDDLAEGDSSD